MGNLNATYADPSRDLKEVDRGDGIPIHPYTQGKRPNPGGSTHGGDPHLLHLADYSNKTGLCRDANRKYSWGSYACAPSRGSRSLYSNLAIKCATYRRSNDGRKS